MSRRAVQLARAVRARVRTAARLAQRRARRVRHRRRRPGDTALIHAVRAGDAVEVNELVAAGVPLDATNARGQTALHVAARLGHGAIAARLLAGGADHELRDAQGRAPLDREVTDIETLHSIRQHYQRSPAPDIESDGTHPLVHDTVGELRASGIARLPGLIDTALLAQLRADFAAFMADLQRGIDTGGARFEHYDQEMYYWPTQLAYITNNAFRHSAALARFCCSHPIVDIARAYLTQHAFIQRAVAMRYLPGDISGHDNFRYHHDLVDQRLKVMVLLTDVHEDDQYMSYIQGSHVLFHPYEMFFSNECPTEYCERALGRLEVFRTLGRAGDVFLFDSNGAHMGNRRSGGTTRDAFFIEFSTARSPQFGGDIPVEVLDEMSIDHSHPLYVMVNSPKVWERPFERGTNPSWIVDLPHVDTWIWPAHHREPA